MKKEVIILVLLLLMSYVKAESLDDPGILPGNPLYFADKTIDNLRIDFASQENKAMIAAEVHNERLSEAKKLAEEGKTQYIQEAIRDARDKNDIIQKEISPDLNLSKRSIEVLTEIKNKVPEQGDFIDKQIVQEKKIQIVSEISNKIDKLCFDLIELIGLNEAVQEEPRCDPKRDGSPKWLERKINNDYKNFDDSAKKKFIQEMQICSNDPRECKCDEIPIKSFSNLCFKIIPNIVKCQFEHDEESCKNVEKITKENQGALDEIPEDIKKEIFKKDFSEKNLPKQCTDAGIKTKEECMNLYIKEHLPKECKEANALTRESCEKLMKEKYKEYHNYPNECIKDGNFIGKEACEKIIGKTYSENSNQFLKAPVECLKDDKFVGLDECRNIMIQKYIPQECKDKGALTREQCENVIRAKNAPSECVLENGEFVGREKCEQITKLKYQLTNGINQKSYNPEQAMEYCLREKSREECETLIKNKFNHDFPQPTEKAHAVLQNLDNNPQVRNVISYFDKIENNLKNIPDECRGLTREQCGSKTGKSFVSEVPTGVIFNKGEARVFTNQDIQNIVQQAGPHFQDINVNQVREGLSIDISTLQAGLQTLEQHSERETASVIQSSNTQPSNPDSAPQESAPISGSAVIDVLGLMDKLNK